MSLQSTKQQFLKIILIVLCFLIFGCLEKTMEFYVDGEVLEVIQYPDSQPMYKIDYNDEIYFISSDEIFLVGDTVPLKFIFVSNGSQREYRWEWLEIEDDYDTAE